jgi:Carboxypeptidase regulatory-like domain
MFGSVSGLVRDDRGLPQMGAVVTLLTADGALAKRALTSYSGAFQIDDLLPGNYTIQVSLDRFMPALKERVLVQAGEKTLLDVSLRGLFSTLQLVFPGGTEIRDMSDDWKWALRATTSTRPVLRFRSPEEDETRMVLGKLSGSFSDTRGYAQLSAGAGVAPSGLASESDLGTAFAVATSMFGTHDLVVSGNLGYGSGTGAPATAFRTSYSHEIAGYTPEVSLTVRQLQVPVAAARAIYGVRPEESGPSLETLTLGFSDSLELGDRVRAEYGFLWESVKFLDRLNFVSPYGRLIYKLDSHRDLQLRYASGVPHHSEIAAGGSESLRQQVSSLGLFPRMAIHEGRPTVQRTEHVEVAYRDQKGNSLLEVAVYQDRMNDTALSASIPTGIYEGEVLPDLFANQATLNAGRFKTAGYRVSYARKLRDHLQAAVGFGATGVLTAETQELRTTELDELRQSLKMSPAQLVMASVSADLPQSDTQFVTTYQWSSRSAVLAPDMYNDFAARSDPGLNLIIRQPLPFSGGLPGKLEATAYLNNLLKAGYIPIQSADGQSMFLLQAIRSYRGALSFVF